MFYEEKKFPWKIVAVVLGCMAVLVGGIYAGIALNAKDKAENNKQVETSKENSTNTKRVAIVNKGCEIWVEKPNKDRSEWLMIGTIPNDMIYKSISELNSYLESKYTDKIVKEIKKEEIILLDKNAVQDSTRYGKYTVELENGYIVIYKYDANGNKSLIEKTDMKSDSLPESAQNELRSGIIVDDEDSAYDKLQDFEG